MNNFAYARAADLAEAVRQLAAEPAAKIIAGGTNLLDLMKEDVARPTRLIDITRLPLDKIEDTAEGDQPPATVVVELDGETHTVSWPRSAKLLDVLLAKGLDAPFSCREGHCGACACTLRSGKVTMEVNDVLEQQDLDDGLILACQSHPESDSVDVTYDE